MSTNNKKPDVEIGDVERRVFEAMRHCGMIPPMSMAEVAKIESELDDIELPFTSSSPFDLLKNLPVNHAPGTVPFRSVETESTRNLARAAREGGAISADVEHRMAEDKARQEQHDNGKQ